ncbi:hypothetical protein P691DRAFT_809629 [Macrolepiota fuliginosa MF-IS2]|uniref:Uncharacterized protein n=1 Tax=Macrolepiota fuliginosa MF-IS2 TaxID=1400762 RepID=A0A9P5X3K8_9AGAR|nr:hypothetical protein P691DRAFT_809629 [Macrolepiota fuliginosa MF-IS2]
MALSSSTQCMHHPPAGAGSTATAEACREALTGFRPIFFGELRTPSPCITPRYLT